MSYLPTKSIATTGVTKLPGGGGVVAGGVGADGKEVTWQDLDDSKKPSKTIRDVNQGFYANGEPVSGYLTLGEQRAIEASKTTKTASSTTNTPVVTNSWGKYAWFIIAGIILFFLLRHGNR